jgi:tRNA threonylcarbamoyladenosine biosynthesis protein TsaE
MINLTTSSPSETRAVGAAIASVLQPGDVLLLAGELGAGKTTLVQGIGDFFGVGEPMTSPTFTLVHTYGTDPLLAHVDVWRLEHLREVLDLGLDELLDAGAIAIVEWGDAVAEALGGEAFLVRLERVPAEEEQRSVSVEAIGEGPVARLELLAGRLAAGVRP